APPADGAGVPAAGGRPGSELGGREDGVAVHPAQAPLGLGPGEAVGDEAAGGEVELAGDVGVLAAPGQRDEGTVVVGPQDPGSVPDPALTLRAGQLVQVQQHLPLGDVAAVGVPRGATP